MERAGLRRLVAVMIADIVGYTRLMHVDESGTHVRVQRLIREVVSPIIAEHRGQVVKTRGDGFLASFESPVEAVRAAIVLQQSMVGHNLELPKTQWVQYRIGINLGDVIIEEDDIYGEGVNIAARLEQLAEPGTIYISGAIYEQIKNKLVCSYQSLGDRKVKNITDPVTIYRVLPDRAAVEQATRWRIPALALVGLVIAGSASGAWLLWQRQNEAVGQRRMALAAPPLSVEPPQAAPSSPAPGPAPAPAAPAPSPAPTGAGAPPQTDSAGLPAPDAHAAATPPPAAPSKPEHLAMAVPLVPTKPPSSVPPASPVREPAMVRIPGGQFHMGSHEDPSEQPVHVVTVAPFWMSKYPVTTDEWRSCVAAHACPEVAGVGDTPVSNVSWQDAMGYVRWLSHMTGRAYRLPTEAEWEYAARAGGTGRYWWGNAVGLGHASCNGCGTPKDLSQPPKVGSFPPNRFGLYDMGGDVAEWVADCWHANYAGAPTNGAAWTCPDDRSDHVLRGGSWMSDPGVLRVSDREHYETDIRYPGNGFRVALSE